MGCRWLTLLCLTSTWLVTQGYFFWPALFQRQVGFYNDPCGQTLYRMRAQGVQDLPQSIYIPPPRYSKRRHSSPPPTPVNSSGVNPPIAKQAPPPSPAKSNRPPPVRSNRPPPAPARPPPRSNRPPTRQQPVGPDPWYPYRVGPYGRPLDPLLMLALDIDPAELPDVTTAAPAHRSGTRSRGSASPRAKRQAATVGQAPAQRQAPSRRGPPRNTAVDHANGGYYQEECYCESAYDCNGEHAARGGRYHPQCDSNYHLVCCCR